MIPTILGISFVVVAIMLLAPGDPTTIQSVGPGMGAGGETKLRSQSWLNAKKELGFFDEDGEKLWAGAAWWNWINKAVRGQFGKSVKYNRPALELLGERIPITLFLNTISLILIFLIAIPIGVHSSTNQGTVVDGTVSTTMFLLYSMPSWWVATMLILYFGSQSGWPIFEIVGVHSPGYQRFTLLEYLGDGFLHLLLPIVCLTYGGFASISRYMRAGMLEVVRQDFVRTARAKGLDEKRVINRHAMRNALIPIVTLFGTLLPSMIGGSIIIEEIFTIPGMGKLAFDAILSRDYLVAMANTMVVGLLTLIGILISDILYCLVDPRISLD